jgi:predicted RNA-binding Zn-ribbon protein involved in translation (DUF1610 family)
MKPKMGIRGQWKNPATRRCDPKVAYPRNSTAERMAQRASRKTGQLIIAYECPDCGQFHIGHADDSQHFARRRHIDLPCQNCGDVIPAHKKEKAARWRGRALYCSDKCQTEAANARSRARKSAKVSPASSARDADSPLGSTEVGQPGGGSH